MDLIELTSQQGYTKLRVAPEAIRFVFEHEGVTTVYVDSGSALDVAESVAQVDQLRAQALTAATAADEQTRVQIRNRFTAQRLGR